MGIVDSLEGVTHAFRSKEYNERNEQYIRMWNLVCDNEEYENTKMALPAMYQFSRLDFVRTVLSKRKLAVLIERGVVDGWDDPRLPTVQGIFRRGLQLEALEKFVMDQAMSDRNSEQEWDKIWAYNNEVLDVKVGRYFVVSANESERVHLTLTNVQRTEGRTMPLAPKKYKAMSGRTKTAIMARDVFVERFSLEAALASKEPKYVILMNWAIVRIEKVERNEQGKVMSVEGVLEEENKVFKGKSVLNWVCEGELKESVPVKLVELDYLFEYDEEGKLVETQKETWLETEMMGEAALRLLGKGEVVQFYKLGCFIVDKPYLGRRDEPMVCLYIPDGKEKKMSKVWQHLSKVDSGTGAKKKGGKGGKK